MRNIELKRQKRKLQKITILILTINTQIFLFSVFYLFKQTIEQNVDLRYVTHRFLKTSDNKYNPNSGQIKLSLEVLDKPWEPRLGRKKWDSTNRTFTEACIES